MCTGTSCTEKNRWANRSNIHILCINVYRYILHREEPMGKPEQHSHPMCKYIHLAHHPTSGTTQVRCKNILGKEMYCGITAPSPPPFPGGGRVERRMGERNVRRRIHEWWS